MTDRHTPDWPTRDWPTRDWPTPEQRRQLLGVIEGYYDSVPRSTAPSS
ncbi:MAG TPA: hypothetical protein VHM65_04715 [Candidatus Lustribacter sp.]|nr:hypothetical protein [Candidatus Lustribacter sp.]